MRRIVLTGGPGAGKSVISKRLAIDHPSLFIRVPEAATQVYHDLQTRWDKLDLPGRRDVQRAIFHLQVRQENELANSFPHHLLLLDRGTIDGAAYWPDGPADYWQDLGTDHACELARYDAVIWLQTSAVLGIYDGDASNACRFEDPLAAIASGNLLERLWAEHPHFLKIPADPDFEVKVLAVAGAVKKFCQFDQQSGRPG